MGSLVKCLYKPRLLRCWGSAIRNESDLCPGKDEPEVPDPPDNCCQSGCANCVWITYASELTNIYRDGGDKARDIILKRIEDPTLKVFMQMQLKSLDKKS